MIRCDLREPLDAVTTEDALARVLVYLEGRAYEAFGASVELWSWYAYGRDVVQHIYGAQRRSRPAIDQPFVSSVREIC